MPSKAKANLKASSAVQTKSTSKAAAVREFVVSSLPSSQCLTHILLASLSKSDLRPHFTKKCVHDSFFPYIRASCPVQNCTETPVSQALLPKRSQEIFPLRTSNQSIYPLYLLTVTSVSLAIPAQPLVSPIKSNALVMCVPIICLFFLV